MRIRHYTPADLDALHRLHAAQGFGYPFPDLDSPLFVTKLVLEEEEAREEGDGAAQEATSDGEGREEERRKSLPDSFASESLSGFSQHQSSHTQQAPHAGGRAPRIVMAALLRLTAEAYLLHDAAAGSPRQRWQHLLALHEAMRRDAAARGLDDVQAFLPPRVARSFGRRLAQLGWSQDPWPCFTKRLP